ncbi:ABC-2 type transport system permease protein [Paenibacillus turicensis]|uniref:ABC-2 type transport system permease protein n=1 Tax=Paenibacillus turicensis TaxID=160487 RepID=A0ABS4FPS7_9BACL|nr:ABC transporter permease [Paenibacillus turicensis]MBP1904570.1 ABC-2 type transport system permease protein [Paenibacillus turicensis]
MSNFNNLVINEWLKLFKKRSFFIPYAIVTVIVAIVSYFIVGRQIDFNFYMSNAFSKQTFVTFLTMLTIIGTAGIVASEYSSGTIKFLLIRTQSRTKILASKYVTVLLYMFSIYVFTFGLTLASALLFTNYNASSIQWGALGSTLGYALVYTLAYTTIAFMVGILTRSSAATIGLGISLIAFEGLFLFLFSKYEISKYFILTNLDLSMYKEGARPVFAGMTLNFSLLIIFVYLVLFLATSFVTFKKRDVS